MSIYFLNFLTPKNPLKIRIIISTIRQCKSLPAPSLGRFRGSLSMERKFKSWVGEVLDTRSKNNAYRKYRRVMVFVFITVAKSPFRTRLSCR